MIMDRVSKKKKSPISTSQNGDQMKMAMDRVGLIKLFQQVWLYWYTTVAGYCKSYCTWYQVQ